VTSWPSARDADRREWDDHTDRFCDTVSHAGDGLTAPVVVLGGGQMRIAEGQGIAMKDLTADALTIRDGDGQCILSPAREDGSTS
jgi:hypothetical protein